MTSAASRPEAPSGAYAALLSELDSVDAALKDCSCTALAATTASSTGRDTDPDSQRLSLCLQRVQSFRSKVKDVWRIDNSVMRLDGTHSLARLAPGSFPPLHLQGLPTSRKATLLNGRLDELDNALRGLQVTVDATHSQAKVIAENNALYKTFNRPRTSTSSAAGIASFPLQGALDAGETSTSSLDESDSSSDGSPRTLTGCGPGSRRPPPRVTRKASWFGSLFGRLIKPADTGDTSPSRTSTRSEGLPGGAQAPAPAERRTSEMRRSLSSPPILDRRRAMDCTRDSLAIERRTSQSFSGHELVKPSFEGCNSPRIHTRAVGRDEKRRRNFMMMDVQYDGEFANSDMEARSRAFNAGLLAAQPVAAPG